MESEKGGDGELREGVVIRSQSGHCEVVESGSSWHCRLRGRLKQGPQQSRTVAVVGDQVRFRVLDAAAGSDREGVIEEVLPRRNKISRMSSKRDRGRIEQVLMANLDQVVVVQSLARPGPVAGFVDRTLATAERYGVSGVLCLNKIDLMEKDFDKTVWEYYQRIGYRILFCSATDDLGVEDFGDVLKGRISLLLGASGTGKSSLLAASTGRELRVDDVTEKTGLGRHTTTRTELYPLDCGGYIADSPGIRGFDPWDIDPQDLDDCFPDFSDPAADCRFLTCVHRDEPECGVKTAVKRGKLPRWRYDAYLSILAVIEESRQRSSNATRRKKN